MPRPKGSKNKVKATKVTADFAAQIAAKQEEKAAVEAEILKVAASIEELKTDVKSLNADLKEIYKKYEDAPVGFEVYQVAVETSKPMWINTVQEQSLPWISVCDLRGEASPALTIYNVRKLPANYLIDRKGDIVAKDLYGTSLEQQLEKLL